MNELTDFHLRSINSLFNTVPEKGAVVEREMRFGCFVPSSTGGKQFQSRVGEHIFTNLLNKYKNIIQPMIRSTTLYYPNDLRITKYDDGREEFIIKKKSRPYNLYNYGLRFSADTEKSIDRIVPKTAPQYIRIRERYSIPFPNYTMDLTKVIAGASITYELEVEFKKSYNNTSELYQDIVSIYNSVYDLNSREGIKLFNSLTGGEKSEACATIKFPKPEDFNVMSFMNSVNNRYGISLKADGTHRFAMVNNNTFYIVQLPDYIQTITLKTSKLPPVVFEGEEIEDVETGVKCLCAFDVLGYHDRKNGRYKSIQQGVEYENRYKILQIIAKTLIQHQIPIAVKKVCFSEGVEELYKCTNSLLNTNDPKRFYSVQPEYGYRDNSIVQKLPLKLKQGFEEDGLIFTPNLEYVATFKKESKDVERDNSYRPIIRKWKPIEKLTIDFLYLDGKLYVASREGRSEFKTPSPITVSSRGETIKNGQVGEFIWNRDQQKFELYRVRYDKSEGNYITIATKLWKLMVDPLYESTIRGLDIRLVRKYHNQIKRNLISNVKRGDIILDIGGGNGGDLTKYEAMGASMILYVEPNSRNLTELKRRLEENPPKNMKVYTLQAYGQETDKIIEFVKQYTLTGQVDVVAMFFSLTFFFENNQDLTGLINTITNVLKPEGKFLGTYTNGKAVSKLLEKGPYNHKGFSMKYTGRKGLTPEVKLNIDDTIVGEQIEYLVDFDLFESSLKQNGIIKVIDTPFKPNSSFNKFQEIFNSLYSEFIFQRDSQIGLVSEFGSDTIRYFTASGKNAILDCVLSVLVKSFDLSNTHKLREELRPLAEHIYPFLKFRSSMSSAKKFGHHISSQQALTKSIDIEFISEYLAHTIIIVDGETHKLLSVNGQSIFESSEMTHLHCVILSKDSDEKYSVLGQKQVCGIKTRFPIGNDIVNELMRKGKLL